MLVNVIWNGGLLLGLAEVGEGDMGEMGHVNDFTQCRLFLFEDGSLGNDDIGTNKLFDLAKVFSLF